MPAMDKGGRDATRPVIMGLQSYKMQSRQLVGKPNVSIFEGDQIFWHLVRW